MQIESDHFVSLSSLLCRFILGFVLLLLIGTAGVLIGYYYGFLDAANQGSNNI